MVGQQVIIKEGFFVEFIHDLYSGINIVGIFNSEKDANKFIDRYKNTEKIQKIFPFDTICWDEIKILKEKYIELNNEFYILNQSLKIYSIQKVFK